MSNIEQLDYQYLICLGSVENYIKRVRDGEDPRSQMLAKKAFLHRPIISYSEFLEARSGRQSSTEANQSVVVGEIDQIVESLNLHRDQGMCDFEFLKLSMERISVFFGNIRHVADR